MRTKTITIFICVIFVNEYILCVDAAPRTTRTTQAVEVPVNMIEDVIGLEKQIGSAVLGLNLIRFMAQFTETMKTLKSISKITIHEVNNILLNSGLEVQTQVYSVLEDAIVKAQHILSPVITRINTILSLVPGADTINAINVVAEIINDLCFKLSVEIQIAKEALEKLAEEKILHILAIAFTIGSKTAEALLTLFKEQFEKVIKALAPLMQIVS